VLNAYETEKARRDREDRISSDETQRGWAAAKALTAGTFAAAAALPPNSDEENLQMYMNLCFYSQGATR
jgi:hypothetical protein